MSLNSPLKDFKVEATESSQLWKFVAKPAVHFHAGDAEGINVLP